MKKVKFTHFHAENFGKFQEPIQHELGSRVLISGANGIGKSTIKRMIMYVLGTKDENGKEISGIRPHDENGVDIDGLTTIAELTISVDGAENTLKRTCFQEKNRQGEYTGKDNLQYFVDDVRKGTKKAYDEYVSTIIPNPVCISAYELLSKETETRRKILEDTFSTHSNDDVIDMHPEYEELRSKLRANTVRDLRTDLRKKRDGYTENGHKIPGLKDKRTEIDYQIKFEQSQKVDIDLAELELLKNSLNEQINEVKEKQANVDKQFEEYDRQSKDILDLHFELNGLQQKANEENNRRKTEITNAQVDIQVYIDKIKQKMFKDERYINSSSENCKNFKKQLDGYRKEWKCVNDLAFDESSLACPYCGNEYKEDTKEEKRAEFEWKKADDLARITKNGNDLNEIIKAQEKEREECRKRLDDWKKQLSKFGEQYDKLRKEYDELPQSIDISDREDVKQLKQQIAEKEQAMQKGNSASEIRQKLQDELEELQRQLNEVQKQLDKAEENNRIDERVAELKKRQLALSQEIADIEKELDLLKSFERRKAELLESDVNSHFYIIKWHMFKEMQNGELADICSPYVGGTSYDGNLNFSSKLLAEVDICTAFQQLYDIQAPVLLDNVESVDDERIPQIENQLILFKKTTDKKLKIECLEG